MCVGVYVWLKVEKSKQSHRSLEIVDWKGDSIYLLLKSSRIIYDWSMVKQKKNQFFIFFLSLSFVHSSIRSFLQRRSFEKYVIEIEPDGKRTRFAYRRQRTLLTFKKLKDISIQFFFLFHIFDITFT